jgi:tetratricopeptide (TPR) repeat protein
MNLKRDRIIRTLAVLVFAAQVALPAAAQVQAPQATPTKESVERRLESVKTLIEKSSAAKQVDAAGGDEAAKRRDRARSLHQQASKAYEAGDYAAANGFLDQAAKEMIGSVRKSEPEQITGDKKRRDFDNRLESVKALQDALKRVSTEKNAGQQSAEAAKKVDQLVAEAVRQRDAGKIEQGRATLDQAYYTAKVAVQNLRQGDTLVKELKFESKEQEYHYEVDRNDTHQMLIKVLVEGKDGSLDPMIRDRVKQAEALRKEAEALADKKDFEGAIKKLDDSTRELVKGIRAAGIFIPG